MSTLSPVEAHSVPIFEANQHPIDLHEYSDEIQEVFRRCDEKDWEKASPFIRKAEVTQKDIQAFQAFDFKSPIFRKGNWDLIAMKAFMEEKIDLNTYASLMLYEAAHSNPGFEIVYGPRIHEQQPILKGIELEATDFIFSYDLDQPSHGFQTMSEAILQVGYQGVLSKDKRTVTVLPPALMEKLLNSLPHPIRQNYVHGYSAPEDFARSDRRDAFLPNPFFPGPRTVHSLVSSGLDIYQHDCFHAWEESQNPHRELWVSVAKLYPKLTHFYRNLLDRNFVSYKKGYSHPFWISLLEAMGSVHIGDFPLKKLSKLRKLLKAHPSLKDLGIAFPPPHDIHIQRGIPYPTRWDFVYVKMGGDLSQTPDYVQERFKRAKTQGTRIMV